MEEPEPLPLSSTAETSVADIAQGWARELPGAEVESILVITTLWRTSKRLADERSRTMRRLGIDYATLDLLSTLRRAGPPYRLTTQTLARRCLVSAGAISQRLARAEGEGLVTREPAGLGGKSVAVTLTAAGHDTVIPAVSKLLSHEAGLVSIFTDEERGQLVEMLERLSEHASDRAGESVTGDQAP